MRQQRALRRLSAAEFDMLRPYMRRMKDTRIEAARSVLVDGLSWKDVADVQGTSRQSVGDVVGRVWSMWEKHQETQLAAENLVLPPGWERVTLVAPSYMIDHFRALIAREVAGQEQA